MAEAEAVAEDRLAAIKRKILEGDAIEQARTQATMLVHQAIAQLDVLPESSLKDELIELAHSVVDREY